MAARERGNAECMADLGTESSQRLHSLEASVEAAMLSQQQRYTQLCNLLEEVQRHKEAATTELQVVVCLFV